MTKIKVPSAAGRPELSNFLSFKPVTFFVLYQELKNPLLGEPGTVNGSLFQTCDFFFFFFVFCQDLRYQLLGEPRTINGSLFQTCDIFRPQPGFNVPSAGGAQN